MLIWMCALHCEAKPIIDRFRLQKSSPVKGFDHYQNDTHCCVVSGIGPLNMAAATAWATARVATQSPLCWINLGIAGHQTLPVGTLLHVSAFNSPEHKRVYQSPEVDAPQLDEATLCSYPNEQQDYPIDQLVDMEGYAFIATASRFNDRKWCHSLKIISDNRENQPVRDKNTISKMIEQNMPLIEEFSHTLQQQAMEETS